MIVPTSVQQCNDSQQKSNEDFKRIKKHVDSKLEAFQPSCYFWRPNWVFMNNKLNVRQQHSVPSDKGKDAPDIPTHFYLY